MHFDVYIALHSLSQSLAFLQYQPAVIASGSSHHTLLSPHWPQLKSMLWHLYAATQHTIWLWSLPGCSRQAITQPNYQAASYKSTVAGNNHSSPQDSLARPWANTAIHLIKMSPLATRGRWWKKALIRRGDLKHGHRERHHELPQ